MDKKEYSRQVIAAMRHLRADEIAAIRAEIEGHIEDRMEPLLALQGIDEEEAQRRSIAAMGDPAEIGRAFQKHYSYFWLWVDRAIIALIVLVLWGTVWRIPGHLENVKDNLTARYAPMSFLHETTRKQWVDMEVDLRAQVGSDILRVYAVGTKENEATIFWCGYDESIHGQVGQWSVEYEDCHILEILVHASGGGAYAYVDTVEVQTGAPYVTAVVKRYGERITLDIPLVWEETP